MKKLLLLASCALSVAACTTSLSGTGTSVRLVEGKSEANCKFIGTVSGFDTMGATTGRESENAMNEARNKAAELGANGIRIVHMQTTAYGTTVTAEALGCKFAD